MGSYINDWYAIVLLTPILHRPGKYNLSTSVLALQINTFELVELPEDVTVSLEFSMPEVKQANW